MNSIINHIGKNIKKYDAIDSTNLEAARLISNTNPIEGTVIRADYQALGKGQIGRSWSSDHGQNVLLSVILYPSFLSATSQFYLSKCISIAIVDSLVAFGISNVAIKWPNDIYVGDKKICGILIQNQLLGKKIKNSIIGIGLNVNQINWEVEVPNPISIRSILGYKVDIEMVYTILYEEINRKYQLLRFQKIDVIEQYYLQYLYRKDELHMFEYEDGKTFVGTIIGTSNDGKLKVMMEDESYKLFDFREIKFVI